MVAAFFLVEGAEDAPMDVPEAWRAFSVETVAPATLRASLPHHTAGELDAIARAYLGVATW